MRNIVMVTYDSLRADHCGYMGYERDTTPNLDAMAGDGVAFTNAIAPASRTNPSMAGVMTGEPMVYRDKVANSKISRYHLARHGTIAEKLSNKGYTTGAFNPNAYASRYYGFDRGFDHFEDFLFSNNMYQRLFGKVLEGSGPISIFRNLRNYARREEAFRTWETYIDQLCTWAARDSNEPFFLWVFAMDTHFPYLTPKDHRRWSSGLKQYYYNWHCNRLIDEFDADIPERLKRGIIDTYDDSIRFGDALLSELKERLSDFDPIFVIHGDHGEAFGERGLYGHYYPQLYEENIHVPLVISGPGIQPVSIDSPISLLNLPQSLLGLRDGKLCDLPCTSVVISTEYDGRFRRNLTSLRASYWKYHRVNPGTVIQEGLFNLADGDDERVNLIGENPEVDKSFRTLANRRKHHEEEQLAIRSVVSANGV